MKPLLLDLNVILDILLDRKPFVTVSAAVWTAIERGRGKGFVPAHGVTTVYYLVARERGAEVARQVVDSLLRVLEVAPVDGPVVQKALALSFPDFEDAVCAAAAEAAGCEAIVSRDPRGFPSSPVPVIEPETALAWIGEG